MRLFPLAMCDDTYGIDYRGLWEKGYRGIIFDIDNTLVEHNQPATERSVELIKKLSDMGFATAVVSNNREPRVKAFADAVGCKYVYKAGKPKAGGYIKAMKKMGTGRDDTFAVGDQLFTDIWGANNAGIKSIMVRRIASHEEIQIHFKRIPETLIVFLYKITHRIRSERELL
ncbi:MAG: YqeG family HAD IIIA-type phosphatase [Lachnospiraceae bacterium]|nr:YqeG family HAD IIIA-type phosphatase [Lachnospiraceae bacterium]